MESWEGGPDGFGKILIESLLRSTVSYRYVDDALPSYARVRQMRRDELRELETERGASNHERLVMAPFKTMKNFGNNLYRRVKSYMGLYPTLKTNEIKRKIN